MLSLPKQISIKSLLYKTTTCPPDHHATSNHFFVSQMKKTCLKHPTTKTLPSEEMGNKYKATYCYFIVQSWFNVYKN